NKGEDIPVSVSTALLHDPEEGPMGAVEIFFDLTKTKKLEEEISRVKTLAALGEMAATVAHEVRNPLGGIGGFAALLKRELAGDEAKVRLTDKIITGVNTLNLTVTALLDYTRREQLNLRTIPLMRLIEESVDYERADQGETTSNVEITVDVADRNLEVTCDPHLMRQVLLNLLRNGREAMIDGGRITIRGGAATLADNPGAAVFVEVADTGQGLPPDVRDKIFQPFFSTKHKHNGSGLGLATVWKTVQAHGGEITVVSEVDNGAAFRIVLPGGGNNQVGAE
ncbi:MAG: ATP-binding protein, partial [candidate division Zixibacteria bacterium]|nr:ATP-binding protein [candidate division Zixibacteria bacterium]